MYDMAKMHNETEPGGTLYLPVKSEVSSPYFIMLTYVDYDLQKLISFVPLYVKNLGHVQTGVNRIQMCDTKKLYC